MTIKLQVECELFPDMKGQRLLLRSVKLDEVLVTDFMNRAMEIFKNNTLGPQKYLNIYKKYADLLNNKAEQEVTAFLKESHSIEGFKKVSYSILCQLFCISLGTKSKRTQFQFLPLKMTQFFVLRKSHSTRISKTR